MTSTPNVFLDTNILVYAAIPSDKEPGKTEKANNIIDTVDYGISAQVLAEFYDVATRKGGRPLTADEAFAWIQRLARLPCVPVDSMLVIAGIRNSVRYRISYWDGAIIAAAERLGAEILYTEDLNPGQIYGSVRVVNPFV
jgi:predicted nucleic acid-binding protein